MEATSKTNLVFRQATPEDREAVREAMAKFFYAEETVTVCYYNGSEVTQDDMEYSLALIEHGYVTLALDGDRIVGLTGAGMIDPDEADKLRKQAECVETEKFGDILRFLAHMAEHANVCKRFGVDRALHIFFIAVDPNLRGKSLAKQLMEVQFELAAQLGVTVMSGDITNINAGKMAHSMGLKCVYTVLFNDYRDEKSGRQVFVTEEPHEARTFVAHLQ